MLKDMARAMCAAYGDNFDEQPVDLSALQALRPDGVRSHDPGLPTQADWLEIASAGLGTLAVAGYAIVPVEPTTEWRSMESAPKDGTDVLLHVDWEPLTAHYPGGGSSID